ncbi:phosphopantetheine-binding protein [Novosphingobium sp.]|jgi:acyl carrier protein|uniref:phosphopantetheine-binding protein n=1 Tax=Novosphingobium sp. TaxID=1874826 RepID=UPI001EC60E42|nr:phosphopantetheine-binding protein [Novosphingobium sp.]MBK6802806.1 hypothetical protein [Novosphingobium sp.]MBK9012345.1 hypothetical protein [Novosphingobium sp.]
MTDKENRLPPTEWPPLPQPGMIEEILDIIAHEAKLDRAALVPGATMESLGIPSLDMVEILFEVEERFGIYVPMGEEMVDTVYLHDLIRVLADQMEPK